MLAILCTVLQKLLSASVSRKAAKKKKKKAAKETDAAAGSAEDVAKAES